MRDLDQIFTLIFDSALNAGLPSLVFTWLCLMQYTKREHAKQVLKPFFSGTNTQSS